MIAKGWAKIGLDAIFKPERQAAALLSMATKGMSMDDAPEGEEESESHEDAWERQAEENSPKLHVNIMTSNISTLHISTLIYTDRLHFSLGLSSWR